MNTEKLSNEWLVYKKSFVKLSTWAYYENIVRNYIIPYFGLFEIDDISEKDIQNTINLWHNGEKGLKNSTIKNIIMILRQCLYHANKFYGIALKEYSLYYEDNIHYIKQRTFDDIEYEKIICAATDNLTSRNLGIIISIKYGIRIGELCALQWSDIDKKHKLIRINKTLQRVYIPDDMPHTKIIITSPKTYMSTRDIPLSENMMCLINKISFHNSGDYILSNSKKYIEPRTYRRYFYEFLKKNNIEKLNFHCLRHTFATACIEKGANIKCVSEILGHSTVNTTLNMYVHPSIEDKRRCIIMNDI